MDFSKHQRDKSQSDASIIITTYNWPEALNITLHTILNQSIKTFEIIIADDGSKEETAEVAKKVLKPSGFRWTHVRHNDDSIRQARIKNLAVKYSNSPYLIFIDHDVLLNPHFISDHLNLAEKNIFLQGKRVFLPEQYTKSILSHNFFTPPNPFLPGLENRKNAFRFLKLGRILAFPKKFQKSLRGCNISMLKEDFMEVDGYDELFDGLWGREDSDICYRLFHSGKKIKNLWFMANQYHLYHNTIKNREPDRLDLELKKNLQEKRIKAQVGFSKLTPEGGVIDSSEM